MQSKPETYKGKFYFKVISCACAICAGSSPLVFSAQAESDRVHWTEFREIYDRINKTTDKAKKKVVEGIVKYLNAKHQLVYGNDEYVDRFIIAARYLGLQDKIRNRIANRQQKAAYEAAQAAKGPAPRGGIGATVAAIGVAMAAMGLASLSSLDDVGKK